MEIFEYLASFLIFSTVFISSYKLAKYWLLDTDPLGDFFFWFIRLEGVNTVNVQALAFGFVCGSLAMYAACILFHINLNQTLLDVMWFIFLPALISNVITFFGIIIHKIIYG